MAASVAVCTLVPTTRTLMAKEEPETVFMKEPQSASPIYLFGNPKPQANQFGVLVASSRAGLTFTDSEAVDIRVKVLNAAAVTQVNYTFSETEGSWKATGAVKLKKGESAKTLPVNLPGRGLYRLEVTAASGGKSVKIQTSIGVVFTPDKADPKSPWGIFFTPHIWFNKELPDAPQALARGHRLLGASWSRLNFWASSYGNVTVTTGEKPRVTVDYKGGLWKEYARALKAEGVSIMGTIAQCPRELSSKPDDASVNGDAGPTYNRVKPHDWALWEELMEKMAKDFRDEIQVWEIWNEPDITKKYWTGTVEDFAELVKRTSRALRRGNPKAKIAASGFTTGAVGYADRLFALGIGKHIDILSFHYTGNNPGALNRWRNLPKKYKLDLPLWNTEEKSEVPIWNIAYGAKHSFKFIHVNIGYGDYRPLVEKDLTLRPSAIWFSVGAHCIGTAKYTSHDRTKIPGYEVFFFNRGAEAIGVFKGQTASQSRKLFSVNPGSVTLDIEPLKEGKEPTVTDKWGRSKKLKIKNRQATLSLNGEMFFINGARKLGIKEVFVSAIKKGIFVFEAEKGRHSNGWSVSQRDGFSEGRILNIWQADDPGPEGYWVELDLKVPEAGKYEVLFAGNSLARLKKPRSLSPFTWSLGGNEYEVSDAVPILKDIPGAPEGVSVLGTVPLSAGDHKFRLKLTSRREKYDSHYALWFDAVALRKK